MLGSAIEGFVQILFRIWTIGVFYFLNNRIFSWMKDSRTPKIPYQKMAPLTKKENICKERKDFGICLLNSRHYSWKNFIFMNLANSKNQERSWSHTTAMSLQYNTDSDCKKKDFSVFELFSPWNSRRAPQQETFGDTSCIDSTFSCKDYSTDLVPFRCYNSENLQSMKPCSYEHYFTSGFYQKEKDKFEMMEHLKREMCICSPEKICRRAESIDSGFQSFHNIDTAYTCVNTDGVTLYVSEVCYNKEGRLIAMSVGFAVDEDSSEESIFSDEEDDDDNELSSDEEDSICCGSEEDFIVFDATGCSESEQFCPTSLDEFSVAITLNTACPTVEVKISQTLTPPSFFPCVPVHQSHRNSFKCKRERKFKLQKDIEEKNKEEIIHKLNGIYSAGTADGPSKKVHFSEDVAVHRIITWDFAYRRARLGPWKDLATDRLHFQRKIDEVAGVVEPVLMKKIAQMAK